MRFRRFHYNDRLFEYCSITSRVENAFRRRDRACLTETKFHLQTPDCAEEVDSRIDRLRAFGSSVFTTELNTRVYRWLFLCTGSRGWPYLAPYVTSTKKAHPPRICARGSSTHCASSDTLISRKLFGSHASRGLINLQRYTRPLHLQRSALFNRIFFYSLSI